MNIDEIIKVYREKGWREACDRFGLYRSKLYEILRANDVQLHSPKRFEHPRPVSNGFTYEDSNFDSVLINGYPIPKATCTFKSNETDDFWIWFAGFFDANGTVMIQIKRQSSGNCYMTVVLNVFSNKEKDLIYVLDKLNLQDRISISEGVNSYSIRISQAKKVSEIIDKINPYSHTKREQFDIVKQFYDLYELPTPGKIQYRSSLTLRLCIDLAIRLSELHKYHFTKNFRARAEKFKRELGTTFQDQWSSPQAGFKLNFPELHPDLPWKEKL